jgi:hypothetical protein
MNRFIALISLTLAVLIGTIGCATKSTNDLLMDYFEEDRKRYYSAMENNTPFITYYCDLGQNSTFPDVQRFAFPPFDEFFSESRHGDKPLVKNGRFRWINCFVHDWNKVSSPSEQKKMAASQELSLINKAGTTCIQIGFTPKTDKFSDCVLRLMEMQSKNTSQTIIQNNTSDSSGILSLLEEQKKQRELEAAIELMKLGSEIMNPPKSSITCKYNELTKTTVCN